MPVLRIRLRKSKFFFIKVKKFLYCYQFPPIQIHYLCGISVSSGAWSLPLFLLPVSGFQIHMYKDVHAFPNSDTCWMKFPSACIQFYSAHWVIMELIMFPACFCLHALKEILTLLAIFLPTLFPFHKAIRKPTGYQ